MLAYDPKKRIAPLAACAHSFFDELRDPTVSLPNGKNLPPLFDFTANELVLAADIVDKLVPPHAKEDGKVSSDSK